MNQGDRIIRNTAQPTTDHPRESERFVSPQTNTESSSMYINNKENRKTESTRSNQSALDKYKSKTQNKNDLNIIRQFYTDMFQCNYENLMPELNNARFSCSVTKTVHVDYDGQSRHNQVLNNTQFECTGLRTRVNHTMTSTNWHGYNRRYINDQGVYVPELALNDYAKSYFDKRIISLDILNEIKSFEWADSHVSFIYNMLVTWMYAQLGYMQKATFSEDPEEPDRGALNLKFGMSGYESTHYSVENSAGMHGDITIDVSAKLPSTRDDVMDLRLTERTKTNYWEAPYVVYYNNSNKNAESFYLYHLNGREGNRHVNFDIRIKPGPVKDMLIETTQGSFDPSNVLDAKILQKPATIWAYIMDYVKLNRLDHDLSIALELLTALTFQPCASSVEGMLWRQQVVMDVYLPLFRPSRALIRTNLEGSPYVEEISITENINQIATNPHMYVMRGAIYNYYYWYGLYALLLNEGITRHEWQTTYLCDTEELQYTKRSCARAFCISAITGKEVDTSFNMSAGCNLNVCNLADTKSISGVRLPGQTTDAYDDLQYVVDAIYAPVSGIMIDGTLAGNYAAVRNLTAVVEIQQTADPYGILDREWLHSVVQMFRAFGWNMELLDAGTNKPVNPWAPAHEWVIEPASVLPLGRGGKNAYITDAYRRPGASAKFSYFADILSGDGYVIYSKSRPELRITEWKSRKPMARMYVSNAYEKAPTQVRISGAYSINYATMRAVSKFAEPYRRSDFRDAPPLEAPARRPEMVRVTGPTEQDAPQDHDRGPDAL